LNGESANEGRRTKGTKGDEGGGNEKGARGGRRRWKELGGLEGGMGGPEQYRDPGWMSREPVEIGGVFQKPCAEWFCRNLEVIAFCASECVTR
jgi:hypothetical protein